MKIAVTYENGKIFAHFGHCESFKLYEVEEGVIQSMEVVSAVGSGHGALAGFLKGYGVDTLICGGIGGGARCAGGCRYYSVSRRFWRCGPECKGLIKRYVKLRSGYGVHPPS